MWTGLHDLHEKAISRFRCFYSSCNRKPKIRKCLNVFAIVHRCGPALYSLVYSQRTNQNWLDSFGDFHMADSFILVFFFSSSFVRWLDVFVKFLNWFPEKVPLFYHHRRMNSVLLAYNILIYFYTNWNCHRVRVWPLLKTAETTFHICKVALHERFSFWFECERFCCFIPYGIYFDEFSVKWNGFSVHLRCAYVEMNLFIGYFVLFDWK